MINPTVLLAVCLASVPWELARALQIPYGERRSFRVRARLGRGQQQIQSSPFDDDSIDDESSASFRPLSKEPNKVLIDPKTGLYRPMKSKEKSATNFADSWDGFKSIVYDGVDLFTKQVPETIKKIKKTTQSEKDVELKQLPMRKSSPGSTTLSELSSSTLESRSQIVGGYKEREEEFLSSLNDTPAKRLMKEFKVQERSNGKDDVLLPPSTFDSIKTVVYDGIDAVKSSSASPSALTSDARSSPLSRIPSNVQSKDVQARLLASDDAFLQAMEEMQSENPVVRLAAGYKVKRMIEKDDTLKRKRDLAAKRRAQVEAFKAGVYQAGDALVEGTQALASIPGKVSTTVDQTVSGTKRTIKAAQALPKKIESNVENVQKTVKVSVETTKDIIEKTKNVPNRVKETVEETTNSVKKTAQQTQEALEKTQQAINEIQSTTKELATSSKVMLGLEKPVPRPPRVKPPKEKIEELSVSKLGWKALSATGSLAGKVGWVVGKETAKLAWKGASLAVAKGSEALDEMAAQEEQRRALAAEAFKEDLAVKPADRAVNLNESKDQSADVAMENKLSSSTSDAMLSADETIDENIAIQSPKELEKRQLELDAELFDLEQEIAEALRLADEAIASAKTELDDEEKPPKK